jgi:hypothetical protein
MRKEISDVSRRTIIVHLVNEKSDVLKSSGAIAVPGSTVNEVLLTRLAVLRMIHRVERAAVERTVLVDRTASVITEKRARAIVIGSVRPPSVKCLSRVLLNILRFESSQMHIDLTAVRAPLCADGKRSDELIVRVQKLVYPMQTAKSRSYDVRCQPPQCVEAKLE